MSIEILASARPMKRLTEAAARAAIEAFLDEHAPGYPTYQLCPDGDHSWAFWIVDVDTTSYLSGDMQFQWLGTGWPELYECCEQTGRWHARDELHASV